MLLDFFKLFGGFDQYSVMGAMMAPCINGTTYTYEIAPCFTIMENQVYATSLGYYLNPLLNVLLGTLLLGERLSKLQWLAVAIAACAVAILSEEMERAGYVPPKTPKKPSREDAVRQFKMAAQMKRQMPKGD